MISILHRKQKGAPAAAHIHNIYKADDRPKKKKKISGLHIIAGRRKHNFLCVLLEIIWTAASICLLSCV